MITWKAFWAAAGAVLAAGIAIPVTLTPLPWLWIVADGAAITLATVVTLCSAAVIDHARMFKTSTTWQRRRAWMGTVLATWLYAAWTVATVHIAPTGILLAAVLGLLVLVTLTVYGAARGLDWWLAASPGPTGPVAAIPAGPVGTTGKPLRGREATMAEVLSRAGYPWLRINADATEILPDGAGTVFALVQPSVHTITAHQNRLKRLKKLNPDMEASPVAASLGDNAAEQIAIALAEVIGKEVIQDRVQLTGRPGAGALALTVLNADIMARVIPYVDPVDAFGQLIMTVIKDPQTIGIGIDGCTCGLRLDQHGRIIGATRYGKSALLHLIIAHLTRCNDAIVWLGGRQKMYDLVAGWIDPFYLAPGAPAYRPPIDWIVNGQTDTLQMMAAAMRIARYRQNLPMGQRKHLRRIIVIVDEFSYVAKDNTTTITFDGQQVTGSSMAAALSNGSASAGVFLLTASQRSTQDHTGSHGAEVATNAGYAIMLPSKDHQELGRVTGDYKLPRPTHAGEFVLATEKQDPITLKAPYIQSIDPDQEKLADVTVSDVAWARRGLDRNAGLTEAEGLAAAGEAYLARHQFVTDAMIAYLTDNPVIGDVSAMAGSVGGRAALSPRAREAYEAMTAALAVKAGTVAGEAKASPRADRIAVFLRAAPEGMTSAAITAALQHDGDDAANPDRVSATLSRMLARGQVTRPAEGVYRLADAVAAVS